MIAVVILLVVSLGNTQALDLLGNVVSGTQTVVNGSKTIVGGTETIISGVVSGPSSEKCDEDVASKFQDALTNFNIPILERLCIIYDLHVAYSPLSIWLSLAAIAEGADESVQKQLFKALHLPEEKCLREKYYKFALRCEPTGFNVNLKRIRVLIVDEKLIVHSHWKNFTKDFGLLEVVTAPLKKDPKATKEQIAKLAEADIPNVDLSGNSIIVGNLDYEVIWETTFNVAKTAVKPFHDHLNVEIGKVVMMSVKIKAKIFSIPWLNIKVLCLPVGSGGRYEMLIAYTISKDNLKRVIQIFLNRLIFKFLADIKDFIYLVVTIPKYLTSFVFDARTIIEEIGIKDLWIDPACSRNISTPAALPSSFIHRTSLEIEEHGVNSIPEEPVITLPNLLQWSQPSFKTRLYS